jgi:hypothetical protein
LRNLILGTADGYGFGKFAHFIRTLRQTGSNAHVCLFLGPNIAASTARRIGRYGVEVIRFADRFPFVADPHPQSPSRLPEPIHVCNYRYFLYYDYLLKAEGAFANVLITDVRDVAFQSDPFDFAIKDRIHVAMERRDVPIGECPWTAPWVRSAYGQEQLDTLSDREMSCSGTTLAPAGPMKRYLKAMLAEIGRMKTVAAYMDQPAHNVLLHRGELEPVERLYNFHGPILTAGTERSFRFDGHGRLVNKDGSLINLIHQYDRHRRLAAVVDRLAYPSRIERTLRRAAARIGKAVGRARWSVGALRRKFSGGRI